MGNILKKAFSLILANDPVTPLLKITKNDRPLRSLTERELIELESEIGRQIFGSIPVNVIRREFFNLDKETWIWHEEVQNADGTRTDLTTKYEIQPKGILKVQPGPRYSYLEGQELNNFVLATKEYYERVARGLYQRDPATGKPF
ncbi:hypothetical protein B7Z17_02810 [Candidatus Saccharibacteria bacterium 32-49-10]|nr:MAG: hypothetical protein B7Z17_02810 [Candidatus Saccharibacteria bacterium 32-49-10]